MGDPPDPDSLTQSQAQLDTALAELNKAQQDLETAQTGPSPADLAGAQGQLARAQSAWEQLKNGPDPVSLQQAQAQLAEAQANLTLVQQEKLELDLQAPFEGTILAVNARPGDRVKDTVITLADLSQPLVEVSIDETDLLGVQTGMDAQVVFDALPDETFTGQVVQIDPSLQRFGSTYAALVMVRLDLQDNASRYFPLGLSASIDILSGKTTNAVLVPVDALHQLENGETVVYVIDGNQLEQRPVTIGLVDLTMAEIQSGLLAGETVATGTID
jgi:HlyD family secretion protein